MHCARLTGTLGCFYRVIKKSLCTWLVYCNHLVCGDFLITLYCDHRVHFLLSIKLSRKTAAICVCSVNSLVFIKKTELCSLHERNWAWKYHILFMCIHFNCNYLQLLSEFHHSQILFIFIYCFWARNISITVAYRIRIYILLIKPTICTNFSNLFLELNSTCTCMTYTIAVCTVKTSWWRTEELSETCRVLFQK